MRNPLLLLLTAGSLYLPATAQRIDHTAAFRESGPAYVRFHYDNDFLGPAKTDYYYTQGYSLEVAHPVLRYNPLTKLLIRFKSQAPVYGLTFEHYGFTPTSIQSNSILVGDRPFAGVILLKSFVISVDTLRRQRLSAVLSTGMIGPAAFAGRMQSTIHRWSGDRKPSGWQYQIGNDVVLNYELYHEKELLNLRGAAMLTSNLLLRAGTLSDKIQGGLTLTAGRFASPFASRTPRHRTQLYAYVQPLANLIGYDATLQGGLFNQNNPYTLPASALNRVTFQANYGVVGRIGKFYAEYYRSYLSAEFKTGRSHRWGGLKVGVSF
ncbi:MAG: lipid A deacylase LpxR family protein [Bacteroidetes bacterium]|nr:lipid A deacylase LpxR family protein [Bacteroidota bacterium]